MKNLLFSFSIFLLQSNLTFPAQPVELPEEVRSALSTLPAYAEKATQTEVSENDYWRELRALRAMLALDLQERCTACRSKITKNHRLYNLVNRIREFQILCQNLENSFYMELPETRDTRLQDLKEECDGLRLELIQFPEAERLR